MEKQRNEAQHISLGVPPRKGHPEFYKSVEEMARIHEKKNEDYSHDANALSNFTQAEQLVRWFHNDRDKTFAALIGIKLARLSNLLNKGSNYKPNNEPIVDTFADAANYMILWRCSYHDDNASNPLQNEIKDLIVLMPNEQAEDLMNFIRELRISRMGGQAMDSDAKTQPAPMSSETAATRIIESEPYLDKKNLVEMIAYLQACNRERRL